MEGIPPQLGDFRILRRLGKGGMAEVFLAEQVTLKRNVAIKILHREKVTDEAHIRRFEREAMAAGGLSHPNIVQVYSIGEDQGFHYIAQEYVPGQNLREYIAKKGPPELPIALRIIRQVASALHSAGEAGIVHRDIKPENILLTKKGEVKVADFGLAQLTLAGERLDLTRENTTLGTPMYMSPEQVNGSKIDRRSDIYSLGVTCYHMLTGSPPFQGETALQVAVKHLNETPEPIQSHRPDLPLPLCRLVEKMMAKSLDERYQSAASVLKDLKRLRQSEADEEEPVDETPLAAGTWQSRLLGFLDRPLTRQAGWLTGLAVVVMAIAAGVGWVMRTANPFEKPATAAGETIKPQETALKQFLAATRTPRKEAAWKAVRQNFPNDKLWVQKAEEKLALLYLMEGKLTEASSLFDRFATSSATDPEKVAFGKAGQAYLLTRNQQFEQSQQLLEAVQPSIDKLDGHMQMMVADTLRRNREKLSTEYDERWTQFLEQLENPTRGDGRPGDRP